MENSGFWIILAATGGYGLAHSLLATHAVKRWSDRQWGINARRYYRLIYSMLAGLGLVPLAALVVFQPDERIYTIPLPWTALSLALQALAAWGLLGALRRTDVWAFLGLRQLGRPAGFVAQPGEQMLVTSGAYRFVRHPLYSFSFAILWLMPVMSWNLLALVLGLSLYMLIGIWFEECKLRSEFGAAYVEYCRRTRILIPWVL
jgi:protein-S-isoprenylcysteine O-methyltransferase Ste14